MNKAPILSVKGYNDARINTGLKDGACPSSLKELNDFADALLGNQRDSDHTYYPEAFLAWLAKYQTTCDPTDSYFRIPNKDIEDMLKEVKP